MSLGSCWNFFAMTKSPLYNYYFIFFISNKQYLEKNKIVQKQGVSYMVLDMSIFT